MASIASRKDKARQEIHKLLMERYHSRTEQQRADMFLATTILYSATKTLQELLDQKNYLEEPR